MNFIEFKKASKSDSTTRKFELPKTNDNKHITIDLSKTDTLSIEGYNLKMVRKSKFVIKFICPNLRKCYLIEVAYRRPSFDSMKEILSQLNPFWNYTIYSEDKKHKLAQGVMAEAEVIDLKNIFDSTEKEALLRIYNFLFYCNYRHKFSIESQKKLIGGNNG